MGQRDRDQRYSYSDYDRNRDWDQSSHYNSGNAGDSYSKPGGYAQVNYNLDDERDHFNSAGGNYNSQYGYNANNQGSGYERQLDIYGSTNYGNQYGDPYGNRRYEGYSQNRDNEPYGTPQGTGYGYGGNDYLNNTRERGYGSRQYGNTGYDSDYNDRYRRGNNWNDRGDYGYQRGEDRDWWDRTKDEVASWFGDDDAERRREADRLSGPHRGKGPKGYTRSDDRIQEDINDRLSDDDYIDASDIEVTVNNRDVILSGTVDSREAKRRAEHIAEAVKGVSNVENRLRVGSTATTVSNATNTTQEEDKNEDNKRKKSGWL
jgi:osmotically-inducible protein OsmY